MNPAQEASPPASVSASATQAAAAPLVPPTQPAIPSAPQPARLNPHPPSPQPFHHPAPSTQQELFAQMMAQMMASQTYTYFMSGPGYQPQPAGFSGQGLCGLQSGHQPSQGGIQAGIPFPHLPFPNPQFNPHQPFQPQQASHHPLSPPAGSSQIAPTPSGISIVSTATNTNPLQPPLAASSSSGNTVTGSQSTKAVAPTDLATGSTTASDSPATNPAAVVVNPAAGEGSLSSGEVVPPNENGMMEGMHRPAASVAGEGRAESRDAGDREGGEGIIVVRNGGEGAMEGGAESNEQQECGKRSRHRRKRKASPSPLPEPSKRIRAARHSVKKVPKARPTSNIAPTEGMAVIGTKGELDYAKVLSHPKLKPFSEEDKEILKAVIPAHVLEALVSGIPQSRSTVQKYQRRIHARVLGKPQMHPCSGCKDRNVCHALGQGRCLECDLSKRECTLSKRPMQRKRLTSVPRFDDVLFDTYYIWTNGKRIIKHCRIDHEKVGQAKEGYRQEQEEEESEGEGESEVEGEEGDRQEQEEEEAEAEVDVKHEGAERVEDGQTDMGRHSRANSGTPFENDTDDIWNMMGSDGDDDTSSQGFEMLEGPPSTV